MKKQLQLFLRKWILNPDRRYVLFIGISFGLAFLIPILGWNPLLLLWIVNGCLSYKEAKSNSIKIFNAVLVLLFGVLFIINLFLGFFGTDAVFWILYLIIQKFLSIIRVEFFEFHSLLFGVKGSH